MEDSSTPSNQTLAIGCRVSREEYNEIRECMKQCRTWGLLKNGHNVSEFIKFTINYWLGYYQKALDHFEAKEREFLENQAVLEQQETTTEPPTQEEVVINDMKEITGELSKMARSLDDYMGGSEKKDE